VFSGNVMTLTLDVTFSGATFSGRKNIYSNVSSLTGGSSGWWPPPGVSPAWWDVPSVGPPVVTADSVSPNAATTAAGTLQLFTLRYTDTGGLGDLRTAWVWFNATFASSSANSCLAYYDRAASTLRLINDAGTGWVAGTLASSGSGTLENSSCAIELGVSSAFPGSTTLTLTLAIRFKLSFAGTKNIYMYADGVSGGSSGWQTRGTHTVLGGAVVTADSVTPNNGSGSSDTFSLVYSDTLGFSDLRTVWVWFNATFAPSAANSCLIYYDRVPNQLRLLNAAGTAWLSAAPGAAAPLDNGFCSLAPGGAIVTQSGNSVTLSLPIGFHTSFAGAKNIYMYADSKSGVNSGWQTRGTYTVTTNTPAAVVTADFVLPDKGGAATQIFTMRYSDTLGSLDLRNLWVWFNSAFSASAANSCLVYYERESNTVNLINDAGTGWLQGALGIGTLQNSACSINLAFGSTFNSGNSLTLNLPITFSSTFNGVKNVFMYADAMGGVNSGWQTRGSWVLPAAAALPLAGTWVGTTAQNRPFTLVVDSNGVASVQTEFALSGACTGTVGVNAGFTPSVSVANNQFSLLASGVGSSASIAGHFGSATIAGGTFSVNVNACPGIWKTTWSATKQ
jgi:hypothetical protein